MQTSLAEMFNETAAKARKSFPYRLRNLVILLIPSADVPIYVAPEAAAQLTKNVAEVKESIAWLASNMRSRNCAGVAFERYNLGGIKVKLVALDDNARGLFSEGYTQEMRAAFVIDHELGHHVVKNGHYGLTLGSEQLAESAADAYATLRHIQRYGRDTEFCTGTIASRNARSIVLFADASHYTTDVIERAIQVAGEMDVAGMSLRKTAKLAARLALDCHMNDITLYKLRNAFLPVSSDCSRHLGSTRDITDKLYQEDETAYAFISQRVLAVMEKHADDADIFKAGQRFLEGFPAMGKIAKTEMKKTFRPDGKQGLG